MGNFKAIWMSFKICTIFILIALIKLLFSGYAVHIFQHNFFYFYWSDYNKIFVFFFCWNWNCTWLGSDAEENKKQMKCFTCILRVPLCQMNFHHLSPCRSPSSSQFLFLYSFCFTYWLQISQFNIYCISWFPALPFPNIRSHFINNWTLWFNVDFYNIINYLGLSHFGGLRERKKTTKYATTKNVIIIIQRRYQIERILCLSVVGSIF